MVGKGRRASLQARQAFLFSNHLLLSTRATGGRLHLPPTGRLPLHDALLVEDPSSHDDDGEDGRDSALLTDYNRVIYLFKNTFIHIFYYFSTVIFVFTTVNVVNFFTSKTFFLV